MIGTKLRTLTNSLNSRQAFQYRTGLFKANHDARNDTNITLKKKIQSHVLFSEEDFKKLTDTNKFFEGIKLNTKY